MKVYNQPKQTIMTINFINELAYSNIIIHTHTHTHLAISFLLNTLFIMIAIITFS